MGQFSSTNQRERMGWSDGATELPRFVWPRKGEDEGRPHGPTAPYGPTAALGKKFCPGAVLGTEQPCDAGARGALGQRSQTLGLGQVLGNVMCRGQPAHGWALRTLPSQPFHGSVICKDLSNPNHSFFFSAIWEPEVRKSSQRAPESKVVIMPAGFNSSPLPSSSATAMRTCPPTPPASR